MPERCTWIRNGSLVTGEGVRPADLLLRGEKIVAVVSRPGGAPLPPPVAGDDFPELRDAESIDAAGLWVLPGGVDAHVHCGLPLRPGVRSLDWRESTTCALLGGTTTVIDFVTPARGEALLAALDRRLAEAEAESRCDFGLHATVSEVTPARLAELPALVARGCPTFKAYLAYKGRLMITPADLERLMLAVRDAGGRLLLHAEDGETVAAAEAALIQKGRTGPEHFPHSRPATAELRAVETALALAERTACPLTIVHLSLAETLAMTQRTRTAAQDQAGGLAVEACPHHLYQTAALYKSDPDSALRAVLSPPLRSPGDAEALRDGLTSGAVDLLSSDHCEFPLELKRREAPHGFPSIPNGTGGVGERLIVSYTLGVARGGLDPALWVRACCERPAALNGLAGRKGVLAAGADADLVLFDPQARGTRLPIGPGDPQARLWSGAGWLGAIHHVLRRGRRVVRPGMRGVDDSRGAFLARRLGAPASRP